MAVAGRGAGGKGPGAAASQRLRKAKAETDDRDIFVAAAMRQGSPRTPLLVLLATLLIDASCAVVLSSSNVDFDMHPLHWGSVSSFEDRAVDVFVLILVRILLCVILAVALRHLHNRQQWLLEAKLNAVAALADARAPFSLTASSSNAVNGDEDDDDVDAGESTSFLSKLKPQGLLGKERGSPISRRMRGPSAGVIDPVSADATAAQLKNAYLALPTSGSDSVVISLASSPEDGPRQLEYEVERERGRLRNRQAFQRNACLLVLFASFTAYNIFVSMKCLYFRFTLSPWQQLAMATPVLWTNIELIALKLFVERSTNGIAVDALVPKLHPHGLRFNPSVTTTVCDVCNLRVQKEGFECATCAFDCCLECYKKKSAAHGQNLLRRGDKSTGIERGSGGEGGGDADGGMSPATYILRGMRMMLPFWHVVLLAVTCLILAQSARVLLPNFQGDVIDSVVTSQPDKFWKYIKTYAGVSAALLVLGSVRSFCTMLVMRNVSFALRQKMFDTLVNRDIAFFDGATVGALTARMTNDVQAMISPLSTLFNTVIANVILLVGGLVMCLLVSWKLAMVSFSVVGPIVFVTSAYAKWSAKINRSVWDSLAQANSIATEAFTNIRTVRSFSTEAHELERFSSSMTTALQQTLRDAIAFAGSFFASNILDLSQSIIILAFGGMTVIYHPDELSIGQLVTFQLYVNMMNGAYQALNGVLNQFTRSAGAAERVLAMLETFPDIDGRLGARIPLDQFSGHLALRNVSFKYQMRPDKIVLDKVNMDFPQGKMTAIVGRSGSGKSTVMHLLLRFYDPTDGEVLIDDRNMKEVKLSWLHRHMAVVAQDTQLFNCTIEENIRYGITSFDSDDDDSDDDERKGQKRARVCRRPVTMEDVRQAAIRANAHDFIESFPDGYYTTVGERGVRLSGGQRQRIAIARAFLRKPRILLLDEATSALDAESESQVQQALDTLIGDLRQTAAGGGNSSGRRTTAGCAIIVVAHRLSTVMNADKIIVLGDGSVQEQGTHAELLETKGPYYQLVNRQLQEGRFNASFEDVAPRTEPREDPLEAPKASTVLNERSSEADAPRSDAGHQQAEDPKKLRVAVGADVAPLNANGDTSASLSSPTPEDISVASGTRSAQRQQPHAPRRGRGGRRE